MKYNIPLPRLLDGATMRESRRISATDASCALSITPLSTYTIQAPYFEEIPERSWVEGFGPNGSLGIYRLRSPGRHFGKDNRTFSFEHGIVEVGDYILNGELKTTGTAGTILSQIFSHYRGSLWQLGSIATTPEIRFDNGYCDLLTAVNEVLGQLPDYMLTFDQTSLPWKMNLVAKPATVRAEGRLTRNILSARITYDDSELCTRLYNPVSSGGYMDADTISRYGVVEGWAAKDDSDQTDAAFLAECSRYLRQHKEPLISVTIEMLDLQAITGEELDGVEIGDLFRLALVDYNLTHEQTVVSINYPSLYGSPGRATVTLGNEEMTMSKSYSSSEAAQARTNYRQGGINNTFAGAIAGNTQALTIQSDEIAIIGGQARQNRIDINDQGIRLSSTENTLVGTTQRLDQAEINITSQGVSIGALRNDYNTVSGKQTTMEAQITVMAGEISSKVSRTDYDELENVVSRHSTEISQNADQIALKVSQGDVATQLAVEMGNVSITNGNLIVDGIVTAAAVKSAIAQISDLTVGGTVRAQHYYLGTGAIPVSVDAGVYDIQIVESGNNAYTLQKQTYANGQWQDVKTFSRATSLSGAWGGAGVYTVTASPQGNTVSTALVDHLINGNWNGNVFTGDVAYAIGENAYSTGRQISVDASSVYTAGDTAGYNRAKVSGSWSNGTYTATKVASGSNSASTSLASQLLNGSWSSDKKTYTGNIAYAVGESLYSTGRQVTVNASEAYSAGEASVTADDPYAASSTTGTKTSNTIYSKTSTGKTEGRKIYLDYDSSERVVWVRWDSTSGTRILGRSV